MTTDRDSSAAVRNLSLLMTLALRGRLFRIEVFEGEDRQVINVELVRVCPRTAEAIVRVYPLSERLRMAEVSDRFRLEGFPVSPKDLLNVVKVVEPVDETTQAIRTWIDKLADETAQRVAEVNEAQPPEVAQGKT